MIPTIRTGRVGLATNEAHTSRPERDDETDTGTLSNLRPTYLVVQAPVQCCNLLAPRLPR